MKNENILRHLNASFIKIVEYGVEKMVYISCKPSSLGRDLEVFLREGYRVDRVCCVDQFCQTVHVETCCLLSRKIDTPTIEVEMKVETEDVTEKPTYKKINEYVEKKYGFKVNSKYIAEVKTMCGLPMHEAPNKTDTPKREYPKCPPEKVEAIKDALHYFELIE